MPTAWKPPSPGAVGCKSADSTDEVIASSSFRALLTPLRTGAAAKRTPAAMAIPRSPLILHVAATVNAPLSAWPVMPVILDERGNLFHARLDERPPGLCRGRSWVAKQPGLAGMVVPGGPEDPRGADEVVAGDEIGMIGDVIHVGIPGGIHRVTVMEHYRGLVLAPVNAAARRTLADGVVFLCAEIEKICHGRVDVMVIGDLPRRDP